MDQAQSFSQLPDGVVYNKRENICPFSTPPLEAYAQVVGEERILRLLQVAERLKGLKIIELNATAQGGGVAEMLYSQLPFINLLGIAAEWRTISGNDEFFECTKRLHNLLQGMEGSFTAEMEAAYTCNIGRVAQDNIFDSPDVVTVHDPQPLALASYIRKPYEGWLWRCHIDVEDPAFDANPGLWDFMTRWIEHYDAAIFSAAHYIISRWPVPHFIIPPFIDPLSEKNRELSQEEISAVLDKYQIDPKTPMITQIGRFDPWKGLHRTIDTFRLVRKEAKCQLIIAGGLAADDPESQRILNTIQEETKHDEDIHVLHLSLANRLENWRDVNALQRAAAVIMQPSTREGFGLVITEALWKGKPVIASNVGAIPLQLRDGDTGYYYETPQKTADKVFRWLKRPRDGEIMGIRGRQYVKEHFLMPDRMADYLMTIDMTMNGVKARELPKDGIISFHPWFKMNRRRRSH
ncbi:MAG: glycosyltransferase [Dehalococcoidia bacterium]|nr:glycosyltransferase [Dehalococcoidia bacterium]